MISQELVQKTIASIGKRDIVAQQKAHERLEQLTMPHWALGKLLDLAEKLSGISGQMPPPVARRSIVIFAGDHGVAAEGVSLFPQEVTAQMIANFASGGAGANALAKVGGANLHIVDMGCKSDISPLVKAGKVRDCKIAAGTANMAVESAMTQEQAYNALAKGIQIANELAPENDILAAGEMGIANTTSAAAILSALGNLDPDIATGRGTGLDDRQRQHKVSVIRKALALHPVNSQNGLQVLIALGGFEIAGITGFYLGAAAQRKAIVVDGFICTAAALVAQSLCPSSVDFMVSAHRSVEPGHQHMLQMLGLDPLLDLNFRLGEGTGAAMSFPLFDGARAMLTDVATFAEAQVSGKKLE